MNPLSNADPRHRRPPSTSRCALFTTDLQILDTHTSSEDLGLAARGAP